VYDYSGLTEEEIKKGGWMQIVHPDDREANEKEWLNAISTGRDFLFEHRFRKHTGEYRWQLSRAIPQRDAFGNIQMWVGASTDIQEIKELEKQKDLFISMASHELKTPITSIKGYVQILQSLHKDSADEFLKSSLAIIDKQVVILTSLISDLLDLSKIKSDNISFNKEVFLLNEIVHEIANEIKHIHPGHRILVSAEEAKTVRVYADRNRIGQVLINFLTNAVKYAPSSTEIQLSVAIQDGNAVVSVKDFGIGIKQDDQKRIFERFYRVEGKNEKRFPGFGIGLFIASEIVRKHDGKIGVESEPGKGSVFYFSLPVQQL
jgi:PAS domain S-box-containing protein